MKERDNNFSKVTIICWTKGGLLAMTLWVDSLR